jgi:hypothetical protein
MFPFGPDQYRNTDGGASRIFVGVATLMSNFILFQIDGMS